MATILPLPSNFNSPSPDGKDPTPAIAIVTLVAVILCALILLLVLLYFIILRFWGHCPNCPHYEEELKKWKSGDPKTKTIQVKMVQERMRAWDPEKNIMDLQAQIFKDQLHMQTFARLEGGTSNGRWSDGQMDSFWSQESIIGNKEKENMSEIIRTKPQETILAHVVAAVAQNEQDAEVTLVNPTFTKPHPAYLQEVVAPHELEAKRSSQEAEEQVINRPLDIASDPSNRESVQERPMNKSTCIIVEQDAKDNEVGRPRLPITRKEGESRFKEHFSWETNDGFERSLQL